MDKIIDFEINETREDKDKVNEVESLCKNNTLLSLDDINVLLRNICYLVRKQIAEYSNTNMKDYAYSYKCDLAQSMIYYYLNDLGIKVNPINTNEVINGVCGHSLIVATFNTEQGEKDYLIDPTYIQFFEKNNCDINRFIIIKDIVCRTPDPGFFVLKSNKINIIKFLLKYGYIDFSEDIAKVYGDSFFQTKQGINITQIKNNVASGKDYIKWFKNYRSNLSKRIEELENMSLLIISNSNKSKIK